MSSFASFTQISQRACSSLYATNFFNKFSLKRNPIFNRNNGSQFDDHACGADIGQLLFAQPVATTSVKRVGTAFVFSEANVKWSSLRGLPDVDVHGVLLDDAGKDMVPQC